MTRHFFSSWSGVFGILLVGILAYFALVLFLRVAGNRTLSKLNVFDLVVTVSLGSTLATVVISKDVPLADGAMAFFVLIALQFIVTWTNVRVKWVRKLVTGEPILLLHQGRMLDPALLKARVAEDEVFVALRMAGMSTLDQAEAVVLETDGSLTVIGKERGSGASTLDGVRRI